MKTVGEQMNHLIRRMAKRGLPAVLWAVGAGGLLITGGVSLTMADEMAQAGEILCRSDLPPSYCETATEAWAKAVAGVEAAPQMELTITEAPLGFSISARLHRDGQPLALRDSAFSVVDRAPQGDDAATRKFFVNLFKDMLSEKNF
ncbi:hypothetical protein [Celeribacter ethanolicus]|uniref:hypothetical protein n=1 Tax=Celeribacter ethanolicus TaxID=1758178 RepID=UPI00082B67DF|nr:hypothetical protein [Celeribacter ethanolicus]